LRPAEEEASHRDGEKANKQTNKQPRFASHLRMNAPDRTWILQEEDRIKSLMKKFQRNNRKAKLKNNNDNPRTQSSLRRSRVEFLLR
jgi:hypothetical protein